MNRVSLVALIVLAWSGHAVGADIPTTPPAPESHFASVDAFVEAMEIFTPASTDNYFGYLFSAPEVGQPGVPDVGAMIRADTIKSCQKIWTGSALDEDAGPDAAFVFVSAHPPTQAAHSCVGVLFYLTRAEGEWVVADYRKFLAYGRFPEIDCKLTCYEKIVDVGPPKLSQRVFVTVTENNGGNGAGEEISQTYRIQPVSRIGPAEMR